MLDWDLLESFVRDQYVPILSDQVFESSAGLQYFRSKADTSKGGRNLVISPILYDKISAAGTVKGFGPVDINPNDKFTAAMYEWATFYASIALSFDQLDAAQNDPNAIMNLVDAEMKVAKMTLSDLMGEALFNAGVNAEAPHGLRHIINIDRTLGGINSTNYSWWDGNKYSDTTNYTKTNMTDPASAYYVLELMRNAWNAAKHNNSIPDIILCTDGWEKILENELQPLTRYANADVKGAAAVNIASFNYKGKAPIVPDDLCPDGELFMNNSEWCKLYIHRARNFDMGPFQKPVDRLAMVSQITVKAQWASNGPRMLSRIQAATSIED